MHYLCSDNNCIIADMHNDVSIGIRVKIIYICVENMRNNANMTFARIEAEGKVKYGGIDISNKQGLERNLNYGDLEQNGGRDVKRTRPQLMGECFVGGQKRNISQSEIRCS